MTTLGFDLAPTTEIVFDDGSRIRLPSALSSVEVAQILTSEGTSDAQVDPGDGKFGFKDWARNNTPGKKGFQKTGDDSFEGRLGRCYELSGRYVAYEEPSATLVHGTIQGMGHPALGHAWAEMPNGDVWEPATNRLWPGPAFKGMFNPTVSRRYSHDEVMRHILDTEHWGPWDATIGAKEWARNNVAGKKGFQPVSSDEGAAVHGYIQGSRRYRDGYVAINGALRRGQSNAFVDAEVAKIDSAIDKAGPLSEMTVSRITNIRDLGGDRATLVGRERTDLGYLSTTKTGGKGVFVTGGDTLMTIHVPAGSRGLDVNGLPWQVRQRFVGTPKQGTTWESYDEVILARGTTLRIRSISQSPDWHGNVGRTIPRWLVDAEVVP